MEKQADIDKEREQFSEERQAMLKAKSIYAAKDKSIDWHYYRSAALYFQGLYIQEQDSASLQKLEKRGSSIQKTEEIVA